LRRRAGTAAVPAPGDSLGGSLVLERYRLDRRLGAGGFGVVWLAYDVRLEREVAIKAIPREDDAGARGRPSRASREARAAARLAHPGIVALYELGADEHQVYLVSELVRGRTLAELSRAGAVADRDVARVGVAICDALAHAHERGVIHRDVKPQNVMVVAEPAAGAGFAKLTDFGVAHLATGDPLTRTGDVVGTLAYMAPEQADGGPASPAADVYSLALTLYEAFAGRNPVRAPGPIATARRLGRRLPPLAAERRDLPLELCKAIDAALEPRPEARPALPELRAALDAADGTLSEAGGLVEAETLERFGLTAVASRRAIRPALPTSLEGPLGRLVAGVGAGLLVLTALEALGPAPPVSPLGAAAVAALSTAVLPRVAWIAAALGVCAWLASPGAGQQGTALVLAAALAPVPLLLPRAGALWSLPALAPLLGAIALAPLYVALAGLVSTVWRRAGLAAAGFLWLAAAEVLTGTSLLFGTADGTRPRSDWEGSLAAAATDAIYPAVSSPALAPLVVWAAFAAILPLLVRGRSLALDLVVGGAWAAALVTAQGLLGELLAASVELAEPRGAVAGAVLGALVAIAVRVVTAPAPRRVPAAVPLGAAR